MKHALFTAAAIIALATPVSATTVLLQSSGGITLGGSGIVSTTLGRAEERPFGLLPVCRYSQDGEWLICPRSRFCVIRTESGVTWAIRDRENGDATTCPD